MSTGGAAPPATGAAGAAPPRRHTLRHGGRVVVVRLSAMGDVVQSVGAVRALAAARPDLAIHWVVQRPFAPLLTGLPGLAGIVEHDRRGGVGALLATVRAVRRLAPDAVLDLQGNWKSAAIAWLARAPRIVGPAGSRRRERASAWLCAEEVHGTGRHPAQVALDVVRHAVGEVRPRLPRLYATRDEIERELDAVRTAGIDPTRPFRVLALGSDDDPRAWRRSGWIRSFADQPAGVLAVLGPDEAALRLPSWLACVRHGPGEVRRLIALGAICARSGGDCIAPDKGPAHVLAAGGARTYTVHGPTDPARTGVPGATVLLHPSPPPCAPCDRRRCRHPSGPVCTDIALESAVRTGGPLPR